VPVEPPAGVTLEAVEVAPNPVLGTAPAWTERVAPGEKGKARDILAAIKTLKQLEEKGRAPTDDDRTTLARFGGFGPVALSVFPDPVSGEYKDAGWEAIGRLLKEQLSPDEYDSAKRTTFNAFYTSPVVIDAIHQVIARLGVPPDAVVLEPGCGTGNFLGRAPAGMHFVGVEMDSISGRITQALYPSHDVRVENFRDTMLPENGIDAVVGNVPFADLKYEYNGQRFALHDFFFAKAVDALRPGGVAALVTTHYTLDKQNAAVREYLAEKADFIGAVRLPSDAFRREGTAVVTDILILRKRAPGEPERHADPDWLVSAPFEIDGVNVGVNRYFHTHPEMVLGSWSLKDTLYGAEGYSVTATGDLAEQLRAAVGRLPEFPVFRASPRPSPDRDTRPATEPHIGEGSFFVRDGRIHQQEGGRGVPVVYGGGELWAGGALTGRRLGDLIGLRDRARAVLRTQNEGRSEQERETARRELNRAYDRFVAAYGPVNKTTFGSTEGGGVIRRMPNLVKFREDPDAMLVMALEEYDEVTGKATKAAILLRDVVGRTTEVTNVATAEEGLLVSLNQRGTVDIAFISELYGHPEGVVVSELADLIYLDPETHTWITVDDYLSGNVRSKLATAESAGEEFNRNAEALRAVQPEDVLPGDIDANLGAPWVPAADVAAFAAALFRVDPSEIKVGHLKTDAVWCLEAGYSAERSVAATSEFGTGRANGTWLLDLALNMKTPVIYDTVSSADREERVVNPEETLAAKEKQKLIKERFRAWVFTDPERTERLVRVYNDTYNTLRPRLFDGSHLDFPGMSRSFHLRPHQAAAVWRGMTAGNTLLAHCVGAGKTFTMAATGMKMRQAALVRKPMYVVPNHMLEQFSREFIQLYPNAKLLVATKDDLGKDRRKFLTAKIASGEWDGIIVTHSSFERMGMSRPYQEAFLKEQIAEYDQLLRESAAANGSRTNRNLIKTIEKQKARRESRLTELLAGDKKDDGLVFDELGVDHVFVDEAHYFKNLETPTKMERVAGVQTGGSERAFDLFMKCRYLGQRRRGRGVTFATGTPISNTMVELYTLQRFLDTEGMKARGIDHFDGWAATFGEVVETMEISPDGASLRPRSRFARFVNLPELQQMFRAFADVQTADMLNLPRPELDGGKPQVVACPMSGEQYRLQQELVERYDTLRTQKIDPREDNALAVTTDGRKLALDARMLSASAPDFPDSKVNRLVATVREVWQDTAATRGTQMVFCDMGVLPTAWGYSAYGDVTRKLIAGGIPAGEIASIGEADSDAKKQALFDKVRAGTVRVILGSTQKMGTGTNVQKRLAALHHLDAPWKPAEVEQREGRILRQGNENERVAIYRYVTAGSFDAYMWQALETKAKFIGQVMSGEVGVRKAEDVGGQELSYAEVKAIASGNPAVLTLAEADADLQRLAVLKKNHTDEQYLARRHLHTLPERIARLGEHLRQLEADATTVAETGGEQIGIGEKVYSYSSALDVLGGRLERLPEALDGPRDVPLGLYRGLRFGMVLHPKFPPDVYLHGQTRHRTQLGKHIGPRAVLNALARLTDDLPDEVQRARQEHQVAQTQLRDYQGRLGTAFPHDRYLAELGSLRDDLRHALSGRSNDPTAEAPPDAAQVADRIKALKAGQTLDAPAARTVRSGPTAETPVTERVRERVGQGRTGVRRD
jgi:N12 class adenine-specific DNA methylase